MTLLNVFVSPERGDIWADAAYIERDGTVRQFASKAIVLEAIPAVVAVSGDGDAGLMAYLVLRDRFFSFDDLEAGFVDALRQVDQLRSGESRLAVFLVGWSQKHGAVRGVMTSNMNDYADLEPWGVMEVGRTMQPGPAPFLEHLKEIGLDPTVNRPLSKLEAYRIAMAQRGVRGLVAGQPDATAVGGFLSHVVVNEHGVYTSIAHRWPDRVGERIEAA